MSRHFSRLCLAALAVLLAGCNTTQGNLDYTAFRDSKPASILILPPLNTSVDPAATHAVLAQATLPLAESGYYVVPVAVMTETFQHNGLTSPEDIHDVSAAKLRDIFGADAALYLTVKEYGAQYAVLSSAVTVSIDAELIDLRTGTKLWEGTRSFSETSGNGGGGLLGMLVQAIVSQIVNSVSDRSYPVAGATNQLLLQAGQPNGILYGPRSPHYATQ